MLSMGQLGMLSQQSDTVVKLFCRNNRSSTFWPGVAECMHALFTQVVIVRSLAVRSYERCPPA